ncbi:hypothetical protein [Cupriavidus sp. WS]|uniref:hypothetical protein n=1 Tax=Cupriavidus sp. WS TaxID=1312922 RepID=UPI00035F9386|nr:hypothetical protein [Cupriavidus sp. WS]
MMIDGKPLTLSGDENVPDMPLTNSQVNHLRRLLAWMRCEYMLDEDMQRGFLRGAHKAVAAGLSSPERASEMLNAKAQEICAVPAYIRQAVKMLTKALHEHEKKSGIVEVDHAG